MLDEGLIFVEIYIFVIRVNDNKFVVDIFGDSGNFLFIIFEGFIIFECRFN